MNHLGFSWACLSNYLLVHLSRSNTLILNSGFWSLPPKISVILSLDTYLNHASIFSIVTLNSSFEIFICSTSLRYYSDFLQYGICFRRFLFCQLNSVLFLRPRSMRVRYIHWSPVRSFVWMLVLNKSGVRRIYWHFGNHSIDFNKFSHKP